MKVRFEWTIPNALSILRLLLIPVFAVLYLTSGDHPERLYWSVGALLLSGLSDALDGYIARRFNQISESGKLLDPLADKLTQVTVLVCVTVRCPALIPLLIICAVKELLQLIGGAILLRGGDGGIEGSHWYGKLATFVFYGVMAVFLFFEFRPDAHAPVAADHIDHIGSCADAVCFLPLFPAVFEDACHTGENAGGRR